MNRISFYEQNVRQYIKDRGVSILVVAGRWQDFDVFKRLGFVNVTISNIDQEVGNKIDRFVPFKWCYQDAENLSFDENSFDFVVVHAALHHCFSPHRALLNMYRVAKQGIILIESRDSFLMKLAELFGLVQTYEYAAVAFSKDCKNGGVNNTDIPNFIYRWTEREIEKKINSYAPYAPISFFYNYGYDLPDTCYVAGKYKKIFIRFVSVLAPSIFARILPRQKNLFSCFIEKPDLENSHFEWLKYDDGRITFNKEWVDKHYKKT